MNDIYFVCSGRDFHAVDWYRQVKKILPERNIKILTDLVEGEGFEKILINTDNVEIYNHAEKKINDRYSIKFIAEPKYKGKFHEYYFILCI